MHIIFTILITIIKLRGKSTEFHQADFCERLMYLQPFHYRTASQIRKKIQDGNSEIVRKLSI